MKVEIEKVGQTGNRGHFRIITPVDVKIEEELRYQKQVAEVIKDDHHSFEKGKNPEFPSTWFLHVTRKLATVID